MKDITTDIIIHAAPQLIWRILTDFERYPRWNPFIREIAGEARLGERLKVRIEPPGGRGMTFKPRVVEMVKERELRWLGRLLLPGLFDGEHSFRLETLPDERVHFIQRECFQGALVPFVWQRMADNTRNGFRQMNAALKKRAEEHDR